MALRLVRQSSETPNITNRDDACMVRYAYGGQDGIVQGFGSECSVEEKDGTLTIGSGRIVLQGWEVDIDSESLSISASISSYAFIYLEIDLLFEQASLKVVYSDNAIFPYDSGQDLTKYPSGVARMLLYSCIVTGSQISKLSRVASTVLYSKDSFLLQDGKRIYSGDDLDNYRNPGNYYVASVSEGTGIKHMPPNIVSGMLKVLSGTGSKLTWEGYCYPLQMFISYMDERISVRSGSYNPNTKVLTWGVWRQVTGKGTSVDNSDKVGGIPVNELRGNGTGFSYTDAYHTDANNFITEGHHFIIGGSNVPETHGFLDVDYFNGDNFAPTTGKGKLLVVRQTFRGYNTYNTYIRFGYRYNEDADFTWVSWGQISGTGTKVTSADKATNADASACVRNGSKTFPYRFNRENGVEIDLSPYTLYAIITQGYTYTLFVGDKSKSLYSYNSTYCHGDQLDTTASYVNYMNGKLYLYTVSGTSQAVSTSVTNFQIIRIAELG